MKKAEFLTELEDRLSAIPEKEKAEAIAYYSDMIDEYMAGGRTEESALSGLARVDYIADQILADPTLPAKKRNVHSQRESMYTKRNHLPLRRLRVWEILLVILFSPVILALVCVAFALILSFFLLCFALTVAVYALDFALAALSIAALLCAPIPSLLHTSLPGILMLLGISLLCGGLSLLLWRGANRLAIHLMRLCKYIFYRTVAKIREGRPAI